MTIFTIFKGYAEDPYTGPDYEGYGGGYGIASQAFQAQMVINGQTPVAQQAEMHVVDAKNANAFEAHANVVAFLASYAMQSKFVVSATRATAAQSEMHVVDFLNKTAMQATLHILDFRRTTAAQARMIIAGLRATAAQATMHVVDYKKPTAMQAHASVLGHKLTRAMQAYVTNITHQLCQSYAEDPYAEDPYAAGCIHASMGFQALAIRDAVTAMQAFVQIYNTNNLRILSEFPSRGVSGSNWTASSTQAGDFGVLNVNTDIEEQIWRSADGVKSSVVLICDTQISQGALVDTLALRNHNLTTSAHVTVEASNDSLFGTIGLTVVLTVLPDNIYWIDPDPPMHSFRYWRITIDDPTNPANFVSIGIVLFGQAHILQGESFVDQVGFAYKDFADTVETEGFTNVSNSRTLKKSLHLEFRFLQFILANFKMFRLLFTKYRTTHKMLWLPTPDPVDMDMTSRFAVFAKLTTIPNEDHNWKGKNADYVNFVVDLDEAK